MNGTRTDARESTRTMALALAAGTALTLASASTALAAPRGERVARGRVEIARDGAVTTIKASNKAIINFESFDIASGETVRFVQPGATARVLNRVTGPGPSQIDGALLANGQVYIVNPAGVIFGANSIVNAAGLVAAGAALSDRDFLDGVDRFTNVAGPVVAEGLITAEAVRLVGTRVENAGTIVAEHGLASMMVGSDVLVRERGGTIAVRLEGGTVENSGTISAPGGLVSLGAGDAASLAVRNTGAVRAPGGAVTVGAAQVTNAGEISADALGAGAGAVRVVSSQRTVLESGSRVSAAGGAGTGAGGEVLVHSIGGDTAMAPGAVVDVSGGALGGDGGFAEVSATGRLDVRGTLRGETAPGFTPATLLLDPFNIVIQTPGAQDAELGDGRVLADQGAPSDTWRVSPASIEGFSGDVRLEATNDIFVTESINKANGGLTLLAGRDIVFGDEFGGFVLDVQVSAHTLDFSARRDIVDRALLTTTLSATVGDLRLRAEAGAAAHGLLSVPSGRTVFITQADSLFVGAGPFGFVANPEQTNLSINVTQGFLILGGDFGGVSGNQAIQNIEATAQEFLEIQDDLAIGNSASFMSFGDVRVDGDVLAQGAVEFHGGLDGTGGVSFLTPGLEVQGLAIMVAAGNGAGGPTGATADAVTNAPFFNGPGGPGTAPAAFTLMQDGAITDAHLPSLAQFGGSVDGVSYLIQSSDGGVVLSPEKVADSALTISSMRGTTIDRALRARSLVVRGPLEIGADITTTSLQRYEGPVTLLSDVTLTGTEMAFLSTLDGPGGLRDVGATVFGGPVGAGVALRFLTLDGPAALTGGSVRTVGGQAYNGPVTLGAHSVLESIGDGVLAFNAALDGPFDLRLTTTEGGLIRFAAPVGGATALRSLFLSTGGADGVREVPSAATVVGVGDQSFRVLDFTMSQHEKLTVLGSLDLGASRSATLGDVVAAGDMLINAPSVTLLRRQPGTLDGPDGASFDDRGLDFVAVQAHSGAMGGSGSPKSLTPFLKAIKARDLEALGKLRHALRTPLNQIIGYSEMCIETAEELKAPGLLADLRRIHAGGGQLLSLINDALAPWKVEAGAIDLPALKRDVRAPLNATIGYAEICVEEAGGEVTDVAGRPLDFARGRRLERNRGVIATNGLIHAQVVDAVTRVLGDRAHRD